MVREVLASDFFLFRSLAVYMFVTYLCIGERKLMDYPYLSWFELVLYGLLASCVVNGVKSFKIGFLMVYFPNLLCLIYDVEKLQEDTVLMYVFKVFVTFLLHSGIAIMLFLVFPTLFMYTVKVKWAWFAFVVAMSDMGCVLMDYWVFKVVFPSIWVSDEDIEVMGYMFMGSGIWLILFAYYLLCFTFCGCWYCGPDQTFEGKSLFCWVHYYCQGPFYLWHNVGVLSPFY